MADGLLVICSLWGVGAAVVVIALLARRSESARAARVRRFVGSRAADRSRMSRALRGASVTINQPGVGPVALLVLAFIVGMWGLGAGIHTLLALGLGALAIALFLHRPQDATAQIQRQAPAATALLASGLRAGYSVLQALQLVARESPEPTASRFAAVSREVELGVGFHEAFSRMAERAGTADYRLLSVLVSIQHDAGGNLAQALDGVGDVLRERSALREQVGSVTAQQRLSSGVLTVLPVGLLALIWLLNPGYLEPMFTTITGQVMMVFMALLLLVNWFAMRAAGRVEF